MIGLFIKKSFFDGWDHLAGLAFVNTGFFASLLPLLLTGIPGIPMGLSLVAISLAILLFSIWFAFSSLMTQKHADFGNFPLAEALPALRRALLPGLQLGLMTIAVALIAGIGIPFYLGRGLVGGLAAGIILWVGLAFLVALQYYLPLRFRFGGGFLKNLRKSFILLFDNAGFSLFLFVWSLLTFSISAFLAFLVPGPAGVALAHNDALRLRIRKYDWLEGAGKEGLATGGRRPVPWKELLAEDAELVGPRSLKGMIFPWKE
ncbi:MAG TPA: hypothetical protein VMV44_12905 [Rectinemataceae bacterium]|nr:hypothetical protein [Rectinemataceae bacterium]